MEKHLAKIMGATRARNLTKEVERIGKGWTATDVRNWFHSQSAAFIPDEEVANEIAYYINN